MNPQTHERPLLDRERSLAKLATRQHGVVSRRQILDLGFPVEAIKLRLRAERLHPIHRGVYAVGHGDVSLRGRWMAAVLACGPKALLSHRSGAGLWGLVRPRGPVDVTSPRGRAGRSGIRLHRVEVDAEDQAAISGIPVTSLARTLLDLAEVLDEGQLERAWEEADRLNLLRLRDVDAVCARNPGRRALRPIRRLLNEARAPVRTRSPLEDRFLDFCRLNRLPAFVTNVDVMGREIDALWPKERLIVELDGFAFHGHRAAFERDRARDAALQAAGYNALRVTHRRLDHEAATLLAELRSLLGIQR